MPPSVPEDTAVVPAPPALCLMFPRHLVSCSSADWPGHPPRKVPSPKSMSPQSGTGTTRTGDLQAHDSSHTGSLEGRRARALRNLPEHPVTPPCISQVHGHGPRSGRQVSAGGLAQNQGTSQPTHHSGEGGWRFQAGSGAPTLCGLATRNTSNANIFKPPTPLRGEEGPREPPTGSAGPPACAPDPQPLLRAGGTGDALPCPSSLN